jgi:general secretion pathway protein I
MRAEPARADGRSTARRRPRGLTLIEVLVALAIVAVTLAAGIKAAGALTRNTERFGDSLAAQWCADNHLALLRLKKQYPAIGDGEFSCEQGGRSYEGRVETRPTPNPNFRRVDVLMSDAAGQPLLRLSTVISRY